MSWWDVINREPPGVVDGDFQVADKPGVGLELDPKVLDEYKICRTALTQVDITINYFLESSHLPFV